MSARRTSILRQSRGWQHGAAMMVMLVILVLGVAAILVSVLSSSSLKIERDKTTADALAKAKEALIARAVSDTDTATSTGSPGSLPCPDADGDGSADLFAGNQCPYYIGKLPWKTLGLPDLRDGSGEELWYALSPNFRDFGSIVPINSDTAGSLNVTGTVPANNVIAIVFAAGSPLSGQNRTSTAGTCTTTGTTIAANLCASNYLEGSNANLSTAASPNSAYQSAATSSTFNDQMIYITHDQLLQPVEMRIAREAKQCLDNYAAISSNTNHRYPWAVPDFSTSQSGIYNTLFGRIAATPLTTTTSIDSTYALTMLNTFSSLQIALSNYSAALPSPSSAITTALLNAGNALITAAQNAANNYSSSFYDNGYNGYSNITSNADNAGDMGRDLANGVSGVYVSTVQGYINNTYYYLNSKGFIDGSMPIYWPSGCLFTSSSYWSAWQQEVFYQVAAGNSPGTSVSVCNSSCLSINGSGNPNSGNGTYRAAVIVGRAHNASGSPTSNPPSYYLEGINLDDGTSGSCTSPPFPGGKHDSTKNYSTCPMISQKFETYKPGDPSYSSVNDLVLCLDGNNYCK
jgi:hypothetical protein